MARWDSSLISVPTSKSIRYPAPCPSCAAVLAAADAYLFCTPEYAGDLPGSFKNLLDWAVGGGEVYEKPVGWINASGAPNGAADAHASLGRVLGYLGMLPIPGACVSVPVPRHLIGAGGTIEDDEIRRVIGRALAALAGAAAKGK